MSKKRGFTLVEVLVVIAITTLVFALVGGAMVFLTKSSGDLIHKSEAIIQAQTIEKHLRSFVDEKTNKVNTDFVIHEGKCTLKNVVFNTDTKILSINKTEYESVHSFDIFLSNYQNPKNQVNNLDSLNSGDYFVNCKITIVSGDDTTEYTFILGIYTKQ